MVRKTKVLTCGLVCWFAFGIFLACTGEALDPESVLGVWLFDEGKGDEAIDSSAGGHVGDITGNAKWVDGRFGKALEFLGSERVTIPHDDRLTVSTFTLMAWIKVEKATAKWQRVLSKDGWPATRNYLMALRTDPSTVGGVPPGAMTFSFLGPAGEHVSFNSPESLADGTWRHVVFTYDMKLGKAYIDGKVAAQKAATAEPVENAVDVLIGRDLTGIIDEVLIANEVFSEVEINRAMEVGLKKFLAEGTAVSALNKLTSTWGSIR